MFTRSFRDEPLASIARSRHSRRIENVRRRRDVDYVMELIHQVWLEHQDDINQSTDDLLTNLGKLFQIRAYIKNMHLEHELIPDQDVEGGELLTLLEYLDNGDLIPLWEELQRREGVTGHTP
ncbi:MAG: hypothetical protein Sylvanvirus18_18 [Sylvanvirus sp.]|uniref:Uncharacterized protein n=1 Tax=Sylvanvirus sp. TaxID=2487774 RepID=A0A3G5AIH8_9VIRU|nr:MAG: hypothetical protein Sylvanvirus18_18 [Sylvanvirus sp.]